MTKRDPWTHIHYVVDGVECDVDCGLCAAGISVGEVRQYAGSSLMECWWQAEWDRVRELADGTTQ